MDDIDYCFAKCKKDLKQSMSLLKLEGFIDISKEAGSHLSSPLVNIFGSYMVKFYEDAYWPDNLSLFTISCEHYWGPKNKIMRKSGIHSSVPCRDSTLNDSGFAGCPKN